MAALILMPQRFLYSVGAAGAAVGILSAVSALFVVPALLAVLGPRINALSVRARPVGLRRVRRLEAAGARGHAPARWSWRWPAAACCSPLAGRCCPTVLTGPSGQAVPSGPAVVRGERVRGAPLPARHLRGGHGHRPRRRRAGRSSPRSGAGSRRCRASRAARRSRARRQGRGLRELRADGPGARRPGPGRRRRRSARCRHPRRRDPRLRQHGALHRSEAEPARQRCRGGRVVAISHSSCCCSCSPARSDPDQDAADERADARGHARRRGAGLPARLARPGCWTTRARRRSRSRASCSCSP